MSTSVSIPENIKKILVTGGCGFIGGAVIRKLLKSTDAEIFNIDKVGKVSDLTSLDKVIKKLGQSKESKYYFIQLDLADETLTEKVIFDIEPDLIIHLAAESHVDRSIDGPDLFIKSNIIGTFNLLQSALKYWQKLPSNKKESFRFHHVSTDEVFGSLGAIGQFSESTPYDPRSPYSASKAASDHLVNAWHHTYGLPIVITNCSNNYGPWQFPEKLIPLAIYKAFNNKKIPLYGKGLNVRDWLYVEDHVEAILLTAINGRIGESYCIGGNAEKTNKEVLESICNIMDRKLKKEDTLKNLITLVEDRPGHDQRYSINFSRINEELGWKPKHSFEEGLELTVNWYIENIYWCEEMMRKSNYNAERVGLRNYK